MKYFMLGLLLSGCVSTPPAPSTPVHEAPAPVTAQQSLQAVLLDIGMLLVSCHIPEPHNKSTEEAVRVANARRDALVKCNEDKAKIYKMLKERL